jgi:hypothetical protein
MADLGAISKDRKGPQEMGSFAYRGVDDLTNALQPIIVKHGVLITPQILSHESHVSGRARVVSLVVRFHVRGPQGDLLDPSPEGMGDGMSGQAQAPNIAMSNAFKTSLFVALCIAVEGTTVDSEEGPTQDHSAPPEQNPQWADQATLDQIAAQAKALLDDTRKQLTEWKHANGIDLNRLTVADAERVLDMIDVLEKGQPF